MDRERGRIEMVDIFEAAVDVRLHKQHPIVTTLDLRRAAVGAVDDSAGNRVVGDQGNRQCFPYGLGCRVVIAAVTEDENELEEESHARQPIHEGEGEGVEWSWLRGADQFRS